MKINQKTKMKINKNKKIIIFGIGVILLSTTFIYQRSEIKKLKHDLVIKEESHAQEFDYTETKANAKSIQEIFNKEGELIVMEGDIDINHKYVLDEEGFMGIDQTEILSATAKAYYQFTTKLNEAKVETNKDKIIVTVKKPTLNKEATHRINNTMYIDESKSSLFSTKENSKKVMQFWEDTFTPRANEKIEKLYNDKDLEDEVVRQITEMIFHLVGNDQIIVNMEV